MVNRSMKELGVPSFSLNHGSFRGWQTRHQTKPIVFRRAGRHPCLLKNAALRLAKVDDDDVIIYLSLLGHPVITRELELHYTLY